MKTSPWAPMEYHTRSGQTCAHPNSRPLHLVEATTPRTLSQHPYLASRTSSLLEKTPLFSRVYRVSPPHPSRKPAPLEYAKMPQRALICSRTMVTVQLRMLHGEAQAAAKFLQSKIQGQIKVTGNRIEIDDEKGLDVKLLLHKFLNQSTDGL